jgi:hypothetical protein
LRIDNAVTNHSKASCVLKSLYITIASTWANCENKDMQLLHRAKFISVLILLLGFQISLIYTMHTHTYNLQLADGWRLYIYIATCSNNAHAYTWIYVLHFYIFCMLVYDIIYIYIYIYVIPIHSIINFHLYAHKNPKNSRCTYL